jgi:hypothetical protein
MKKTLFFMIALAGIVVFNSCKKEGYEPVLDMSKSSAPVMSSPANNASYVLIADNADNPFAPFTWSAVSYDVFAGRNWELLNSDKLGSVNYTLQMDTEADNFASPVSLTSGVGTSFTMSVAQMNAKLVGLMELEPGMAHNLVFRIMATIVPTTTYEDFYSATTKLTITPYADIIVVKPIYMLGDATEPGWNNVNALEMTHISGATFGIVANLSGAGKYIKFISVRGQWAPQWGTNDGTSEGGSLAYRPTEAEPDPPAIPAPDLAGEYRVVADTTLASPTYTITKASETLYLLGDGTTSGWDNAAALPLTKLGPGIFEITTTLGGSGKYFKFIETLGQWAPQYGTDALGTGDGGTLVFRPTESVPDPPAIPCPAASGTYTIKVNLANMTYTVK